MEKLEDMKKQLVSCVEQQVSTNLKDASSEELGAAIDMIKDLSEAIYYCTITEAMNAKTKEPYYPATHYYSEPMYHRPMGEPMEYYPMREEYPMMYADGGNSGSRGGNSNYTMDRMTMPRYASGGNSGGSNSSSGSSGGNSGGSSYKSGYENYNIPYYLDERSMMARRRYMDGKSMNSKQDQMKELEQYTQELTSELTDMIKDASPEEKQLLQQKISMLAQKIK